MADFTITWKGSATGNDLACIERELTAIGPGPVTQEDGYFEATLDWTSNPKGCANLKGRLNTRCNNSVSSVTSP